MGSILTSKSMIINYKNRKSVKKKGGGGRFASLDHVEGCICTGDYRVGA